MLGPNYADDVDEAYRQVVNLNHPTSKGLVKYLATWVKYRAKSQDDLMLQLSHALRDPFLSAFGDVILQGSLRFLSSLEPTVVQAHLLFLKHILPSIQISEGHVAPTYFATLLELAKDPKTSALALQVTDSLLKLMPAVSAEAQSRQAVLPSRSCTINKKKNRAGSALMQEWARINGGNGNNSRSRHSSAATALSSTGPRHLPTLPSSNSQVSRETYHSAAESLGPSATSHSTHSSVTAVNVASILSSSPPPRNRIASSSQLSRPSSEGLQEEFPSLPRTVASGAASSSMGSRQLVGNTSEPFMSSNPALVQDSALNTSDSLPASIAPSDPRASSSSVASSAVNSILAPSSNTEDDQQPSISRLGESQSISHSLQSLAPVPEGKPLTTLVTSDSQSSLLLVSQTMLNASLNASSIGAADQSDARAGRTTTSSSSSARDPMGSNQSLVLIGSAPVSLMPNSPAAVTVLSSNGQDEDVDAGDGIGGSDDDVDASTSEMTSGSERPVTRLQAWVATDNSDLRPLGSSSLDDAGSDSDSDPGNESQVTTIDPNDATATATATTLLDGGGDLGSELELAGRTANDVNGSNLNLSMAGQTINDHRSSQPLIAVDQPVTIQGAMSMSMLSLQSIPTSGSVDSLGHVLTSSGVDAEAGGGGTLLHTGGDGEDQGAAHEAIQPSDAEATLLKTSERKVVALVPVAQPEPSLLTEDGQGEGGSLDSLVGQDSPQDPETTSTILDDD
ncbi:hypothetical protein BCR44DRAFT_1212355 [Catenaria anguillulae PL171]|uniref:Uncharacterized protein n=1 Tax=Catenaria anguillulae PL171 TaxID=765915 RepID=A0A1Y2HGT2_9FUNG|nr:hypothetical protein BCR44DRAFT_1212355 [Catenaria anguillulae PL171]